MSRCIVLAAALALGGCLDPFEPEVGPANALPCADVDSDPDTDVHFGPDILDGIFARDDVHCLRCHSPRGETPIGLEAGGLDLSTLDGLRAGGVVSGGDIVVPGRPCASALVHKVAPGVPFGARMPLDGPPFLTDEDRQLIADWIAEGARAD